MQSCTTSSRADTLVCSQSAAQVHGVNDSILTQTLPIDHISEADLRLTGTPHPNNELVGATHILPLGDELQMPMSTDSANSLDSSSFSSSQQDFCRGSSSLSTSEDFARSSPVAQDTKSDLSYLFSVDELSDHGQYINPADAIIESQSSNSPESFLNALAMSVESTIPSTTSEYCGRSSIRRCDLK